MRPELPSGTVTFLFTDVEGSTRLLHELGARGYAEALAEHRRLIREACAAEGGVEVDTQGDAFFFAFASAPAALRSAETLVEELASGPVQVRVGLHTGTPLLTEEGYVGGDVHRAARIAAAGHGGQVLVSSSTASLVERELRDLGEHRFKDLGAPERVYQLGDADFPSLKSLYRTNLPVPATAFLGREEELAEVGELLAREEVRLLTLTGAGGTGKTRLALHAVAEASDHYPEGVFWVPLAPLREPGRALEQAAHVVGASEGLADFIGDKRMLLLFDNFEHLLPAAPELGAVVAACPRLNVVVTSRELLRIGGEHAYPVPTLTPEEGVTLFVARARAAAAEISDGDAVAEMCDRLDNLPLAIELAAARTRHLSITQLLERLPQRLDLLKGGRDADPRQATLRATIEWSYDLLDPSERELFARVAVFVGGWMLEAAEYVCDASLEELSSLVDKSLVRRTGERYWMLETIREFAAARLEESGEGDALRRRHAAFLVSFVETLGFKTESIEAGALQRHDLAIAELPNIRAALEWARHGDPVLGLRLATSLENFWISYSPHDTLEWFDDLAERATDPPPELRAFIPRFRGNVLAMSGDKRRGVEEYERSFELYRRNGDERGMAILEHRLGVNTYDLGDARRGRQLLEDSLACARKTGFQTIEAMVEGSLASADYREGNVERGLEGLRRAVELASESGFLWWRANMLAALAAYSSELGRDEDAERYAREWLDVSARMSDRRHAIQALALLAVLAGRRADPVRAGRLWGAVEAEEQRGPLGARPRLDPWADARARFVKTLFANPTPELERSRRDGRLLSLDDAVECALGKS
jgi:predicted ATPase